MQARKGGVERQTRETEISLSVSLDGKGQADIDTGIGFLDHMLDSFARHAGFDLEVHASGDLDIDSHHTVEDLGITFGQALKKALGEKRGIARFGAAAVPMDEALARVAVDLSGRPFLKYRADINDMLAGSLNPRLFQEFFQGLVNSAGITLHIHLLEGEESHHCLEAIFKAFAKALSQAVELTDKDGDIPSTKGSLD